MRIRRHEAREDELGPLVAELEDLGRDLRQAPVPDLLPAIARRLALPPSRRRWRGPAVLGAVAIAGAATGVLGASASARESLLDLLSIPGIELREGPRPMPSATSLFLGEEVSFAQAQRTVSFPLRQPTMGGLPDPAHVYVLHAGSSTAVSLTYPVGPGLPLTPELGTGMLLTQFDAQVDRTLFEKIVSHFSQARRVQVNGHDALWVEGPHELVTLPGDEVWFPPRKSANTLIWESGGLTLRLESALPLEQVLKIAESVR